MLVSLAPFAFVGEDFGMVWFLLNAPLAAWVESEVGIGSGDHGWVLAITVVDALALGALVITPWALGGLRRRREPRTSAE